MRKQQKTGLVNHVNRHQGDYSDLPTSMDYHDALNSIIDADKSFNSLTSSIRTRFDNDPAKLLEFAQNEENIPEMVKLGLSRVDKNNEVITTSNPSETVPAPDPGSTVTADPEAP